jgi:hypothetical protein
LLLNNEQGATTLEHVLVLPLFLALLLLTFNILYICYTKLVIQFVANAVIREVTIHGVDTVGPDTTEKSIKDSLAGMNVSFNALQDHIYLCEAASFPTCGGGSPVAIAAVGPHQLTAIRITKGMDLLMGMLTSTGSSNLSWQRITLSATSIGRSEPP